jgi:hypothetical protein
VKCQEKKRTLLITGKKINASMAKQLHHFYLRELELKFQVLAT